MPVIAVQASLPAVRTDGGMLFTDWTGHAAGSSATMDQERRPDGRNRGAAGGHATARVLVEPMPSLNDFPFRIPERQRRETWVLRSADARHAPSRAPTARTIPAWPEGPGNGIRQRQRGLKARNISGIERPGAVICQAFSPMGFWENRFPWPSAKAGMFRAFGAVKAGMFCAVGAVSDCYVPGRNVPRTGRDICRIHIVHELPTGEGMWVHRSANAGYASSRARTRGMPPPERGRGVCLLPSADAGYASSRARTRGMRPPERGRGACLLPSADAGYASSRARTRGMRPPERQRREPYQPGLKGQVTEFARIKRAEGPKHGPLMRQCLASDMSGLQPSRRVYPESAAPLRLMAGKV